jgi:hypothetical protein
VGKGIPVSGPIKARVCLRFALDRRSAGERDGHSWCSIPEV